MADDVLDHHDGVINNEADRDGERHERQIVEAVIELVEHREGADQGERNGDGRYDGRPEGAQEYEDHHHHEHDCRHQRELHVVDRGADGLGAVGNDIQLYGWRDRSFELRQERLDAIDRLDDIGAWLALNGENDGALLVVPAGDQVVFRPLDGPADVADAHGRAIAVGDDQVVVGVGLQQLIVGIEREALLRPVERALGQIDIGLAQHVAYIFEADAAIGERLRVDLHADRGLLPSADADLADSVDLRNFRNENVLGEGVDRGQR